MQNQQRPRKKSDPSAAAMLEKAHCHSEPREEPEAIWPPAFGVSLALEPDMWVQMLPTDPSLTHSDSNRMKDSEGKPPVWVILVPRMMSVAVLRH